MLACTGIEYATGGGGTSGEGAGGDPPTTTGGAPQGGEGGGQAGAGLGGGPGGGGQGGCSGPDACDGSDGDCDGWPDDPLGDTGLACGCYWGVFESRRYVACEFETFAESACPDGMRVAVPQTLAEQSFIGNLGAPTVYGIMVGLSQSSDATSPSANWSWARPGVPIVWAPDEPNDWSVIKPPFLEAGYEQCGDIQGSSGVNDNYCVDGVWVACEEIADECVDGAPCERPLGCEGVFDCAAAEQCVPSPTAETCNGRDDDCNGVVDDDDACNCAALDGTHRLCGMVNSITEVQCGVGWSLVTLDDQAELTALTALLMPTQRAFIGLLQGSNATMVDSDWLDRTGATPADLATFWAVDEPNDDDFSESHAEDCAALAFGAVIDQPCEGVLSYYVCELD